MSPAPLLDVHIKSKRFGTRTVLQDLHLTVAPGEVVCLVGASGCGKSTLLRLIAGLDEDYSGSVRLDGRPLAEPSREIGFIFQEPRLFPWCTVSENVSFELGARGRDHVRVAPLLAEVGLAGCETLLPKQLSGGQAQRVALARGLFTKPRVLLLDEPFSAVDAFTRMKLQDLLASVARHHGITVLLVTHDLDEAVYLGDRVVVLDPRPGKRPEHLALPWPRPRERTDPALAGARAQLLGSLHAAHAI